MSISQIQEISMYIFEKYSLQLQMTSSNRFQCPYSETCTSNAPISSTCRPLFTVNFTTGMIILSITQPHKPASFDFSTNPTKPQSPIQSMYCISDDPITARAQLHVALSPGVHRTSESRTAEERKIHRRYDDPMMRRCHAHVSRPRVRRTRDAGKGLHSRNVGQRRSLRLLASLMAKSQLYTE